MLQRLRTELWRTPNSAMLTTAATSYWTTQDTSPSTRMVGFYDIDDHSS